MLLARVAELLQYCSSVHGQWVVMLCDLRVQMGKLQLVEERSGCGLDLFPSLDLMSL